jgi:predicted PurR-regulated permease PerM
MTRADAETIASPATVSASIATDRTTDRPLTCRRVRCASATDAYRTGMSAPERGTSGADADVIEVDLDWRSVAMFIAAFVGFIALTGLVRNASRSLTWIGLGTLLALALDPLVSRLQGRVGGNRRAAVSVVLTVFLLVVVAIAALFGPPAARQARDLSEDLPEVVADLETLPIIGDDLEKNDVPQKVEDFINDLPDRLAGDTTPIENAGRSIAGGALAAIATILAAVTLLLDGERFLGRVRRLVPERRRETADRIGRLAYRSIGQYFAGSVLVAVIAGFAVASVGLVLRVPLAPLAGVWVALFDLVPQIGGAVGGIPFVLLAFTHSATTGIICAVFFVLYLQFENNILSPLVVGKSVDLSPPATMCAALVGVSAAGVVGALVSVPLLGAAKAVFVELRKGNLESGGPVDDHAKDSGPGSPSP